MTNALVFGIQKNDAKYIYSSARIRALEARMINPSKMEAMIQTSSPSECLKLLAEVGGYQEGFMNIKSPAQYHMLVRQEYKRTFELVKNLSKNDFIVTLFLLKYDIENTKIILKNKLVSETGHNILGVDIDKDLLITEGNIPTDVLKMIVNSEFPPSIRGNIFAEEIKNLVDEAKKVFEADIDKNCKHIDILFDNFYSEYLCRNIDGTKNPFLKKLAEIVIDLTNIKIFLRAKAMSLDKDSFSRMLCEKGSLSKNMFLEYHDQMPETLAKRLEFTFYGELIKDIIVQFDQGAGFSKLDVLCKNFFMMFLRQVKYVGFGIEVLIAYLLAKEDETNKIRAIMIGKLCNRSSDEIRERLGITYLE